MLLALAHTEPGGGSDVEDGEDLRRARIGSRFVKVPGGYRVTARKVFISNGSIARYTVLTACSDLERPLETMGGFVIPGDAPGFTVGRVEQKMGQRLSAAAEIVCEDVFVPDEWAVLLSDPDSGHRQHAVAHTRPGRRDVGGLIRGTLERTLAYLARKRVRGHWLFEEQWVTLALAEMIAALQTSRGLYLDASLAGDQWGLTSLMGLFPAWLPGFVRDQPRSRGRALASLVHRPQPRDLPRAHSDRSAAARGGPRVDREARGERPRRANRDEGDGDPGRRRERPRVGRGEVHARREARADLRGYQPDQPPPRDAGAHQEGVMQSRVRPGTRRSEPRRPAARGACVPPGRSAASSAAKARWGARSASSGRRRASPSPATGRSPSSTSGPPSGTGIATFLEYGRERYTFNDMNRRANRVAHRLHEAGVGEGSGVALMLSDHPRFLDAFFAVQKLGAYAVPVNTALVGDGLSYILDHSEVRAVVCDHETAPQVAAVLGQVPRIARVWVNTAEAPEGYVLPAGLLSFGELERGTAADAENLGLPPPASAPSLLLYTSGTTGLPKAVVSPYGQQRVKSIGLLANLLYGKSDKLYTCLPLFHANALMLTVMQALWLGIPLTLSKRFSASRFWQELSACGATQLNTVGGMIPILLKTPPSPYDRAHKVKRIVSAACPKDAWEPFERRFGIEIWEAYGAVDGAGVTIFNAGDAPVGSLGKPSRARRWKLVDADGRVAAPGEAGELWVFVGDRSESKVPYWKNEEASSEKVGGRMAPHG